MLKFIIIFFMLALVVSLGSGLYFLMSDQNDQSKRRLLGLIIAITYGLATGQLGHANPWDAGPKGALEQPSAADAP